MKKEWKDEIEDRIILIGPDLSPLQRIGEYLLFALEKIESLEAKLQAKEEKMEEQAYEIRSLSRAVDHLRRGI